MSRPTSPIRREFARFDGVGTSAPTHRQAEERKKPTWTDEVTGLMWARRDSQSDVDPAASARLRLAEHESVRWIYGVRRWR
jgi:hypothetical protein